jgi:hypothetical protein
LAASAASAALSRLVVALVVVVVALAASSFSVAPNAIKVAVAAVDLPSPELIAILARSAEPTAALSTPARR